MHVCCVICSDPLDNAQPVVAIRCGHVFHAECLTDWTQRSRTCPECRARVYPRPKRLYLSVDGEEDDTKAVLLAEIERLRGESESARVMWIQMQEIEVASRLQEERLQCVETKNAELYQEKLNLEGEVGNLKAKVDSLKRENAMLAQELEQFRQMQRTGLPYWQTHLYQPLH